MHKDPVLSGILAVTGGMCRPARGVPRYSGKGKPGPGDRGLPQEVPTQPLWCERGPFKSRGTGAILGRDGGFLEKGAIDIPGFQGQPSGNQGRV